MSGQPEATFVAGTGAGAPPLIFSRFETALLFSVSFLRFFFFMVDYYIELLK
jgi:hypothetical protein